jgi:hypothetical protein
MSYGSCNGHGFYMGFGLIYCVSFHGLGHGTCDGRDEIAVSSDEE